MRKHLQILLVAIFFFPLAALAQGLDSTMWVTDMPVLAIARSEKAIYLGGKFTCIGPNTGGGGTINLSNGKLTSYDQYPNIKGKVSTAIPDGHGGWYIGGTFTHVQGVERNNLAHILPDNTLDLGWNPNVKYPQLGGAPGGVYSLIISGELLYIGGNFSQVGGQDRSGLASIHLNSGEVTDWHLELSVILDGYQYTDFVTLQKMEIVNNTLYIGGQFSIIENQTRNNLAAIDLSSGLLTDWNPDVSGKVNTFFIRNNTIYIGGKFWQVGLHRRDNIASINLNTGQPTSWEPSIEDEVYVIEFHNNIIYVGGVFRWSNGKQQGRLVAVDASTGQFTNWQANVEGDYVKTIAIVENTIYIGGKFYSAGGKGITNIAALDIATGQAKSWEPVFNVFDQDGYVNGYISVMKVNDGKMYLGGDFFILGGEDISNLAALDPNTGRLLPWRPNPNGNVKAMALVGNRLYVAGDIDVIDGQSRSKLAAINISTGKVTAWKPSLSNDYYSNLNKIVIDGSYAYIGGHFQDRIGIIDLVTGFTIDWKLNTDNGIADFTVSDGKLYVVGPFANIGGKARDGLASFNLSDRQLNSWAPTANISYWPSLRSVACFENKVIIGGHFYGVGGQNRGHLAAFDKNTAELLPWSPMVGTYYIDSSNGVFKMSIYNGILYVGGYFSSVDAKPRACMAAIDINKGKVTDWKGGNLTSSPYTFAFYKNAIYVAGNFDDTFSIPGFGAYGLTLDSTNYIEGKIYEDKNRDCIKNADEKGLQNMLVIAQPGPYYGFTDSLGHYSIPVDTGAYTVRQIFPDDRIILVEQTCPISPATHKVLFKDYKNTVTGKDFGNHITLVPYLTANVASTRRRRCFANNTDISYCNSGSAASSNVKVHLELPPYVVLVSANVPYTLDKDKHYIFDIGTLNPNQCGKIQVRDSVVCNNPDIRGLTQCTKVWMTPASNPAPSPNWDKSDITLKAKCLENGRVRLGIYNTGARNMVDSSAYRIYLDANLVLKRGFKLASGDSLVLQVPVNGQTLRLEADQRPAHPNKQSTTVTIEACGTNAAGKVSLGFVNQLPQDDIEPEVSIECLPIMDSFDPNDKLVLPAGVSSEHFTSFGQELEYTVRFQNTGNDYAYQVIVVDTLADNLDVSTLRVLGASHRYQFSVSGKGHPVLTWTFDHMNLPDSGRDQAGSNGLVKFAIKPVKGLAEGTRVENFADIFFDYNLPVRTNTVFNTLHTAPDKPIAINAVSVTVCKPNQPVTIGANRAFCEQDTVRLQAQKPLYGQGKWKRISGGGSIQNALDTRTFVTNLTYGNNVFEWSIPDSDCAIDSLRFHVTITRLHNPEKPLIAQEGANELICGIEGEHYQWYLNQALLPDNTRSIQATKGGKYAVKITNGNCTSDLSESYDFKMSGSVITSLTRIYPNPTDGKLFVALPQGVTEVNTTVVDVLGRDVLQRKAISAGLEPLIQELDLNAYQAGIYFVKIQTKEVVIIQRIVLR
jgi:uncharacterized repeat protein (TIGR01451 family)